MGVPGLLPVVASNKIHIAKYRSQVVAVDGYAWLHRGVHSCAWELGVGGTSEKHILYCMGRVAMLLHYGVKPLLIFDGGHLPAKAAQERHRRARREEARAHAMQCTREHRHEDARKSFAKAIDVTPEMAAQLVDACVARWGRDKVDFLVAPYEADAQLAFACRSGVAMAVISEDADLLAYGTPRVLFKLDGDGTVDEVVLADLFDETKCLAPGHIDVRGWTGPQFAAMCVLAGCDYADSIDGVGIRKAHAVATNGCCPRQVLRAARMQFNLSSTCERQLERALLTFLYQTVYCRLLGQTRHLVHPPDDVMKRHDDLDFLGKFLPDDIATGIAEARLEPQTHRPLVRAKPSPSLVQACLGHATRSLEPQLTKIIHFFPRSPSQQSTSCSIHSYSSAATTMIERLMPQKRKSDRVSADERERSKRLQHSTHFEKQPGRPQNKFKPFKIPGKVAQSHSTSEGKENNILARPPIKSVLGSPRKLRHAVLPLLNANTKTPFAQFALNNESSE